MSSSITLSTGQTFTLKTTPIRTSVGLYACSSTLGAQFVMRATPERVGMVIANLAVNPIIYIKFGSPINYINGIYDAIPLTPNEKRVMDYICPTEALFILCPSGAGYEVVIEETVRVS